MARLFGFIGNRPDLASRVLYVEEASLHARSRGDRLGWGVGFYHAGEVLLRRRPLDPRVDIPLASLTEGINTDILVGCVRALGEEDPRTENSEPFRYRSWLFAHDGRLQGFDRFRNRLRDSLPDFLERSIRGETAGELVFYTFLSFLHDANVLDSPMTPTDKITEALRGTCALLDRMAREEGYDDIGPLAMLCSNGTTLVASNRDTRMAYRIVHGEDEIDALLPEDRLRRKRLADLALVKFVVIATQVETVSRGRWVEVPARCTVVMDHLKDPVVESMAR